MVGLQPYAHSLEDEPEEHWEPLPDHLAAVGKRAGEFAALFGWGPAGEIAGLLHDLGKYSAQFQAYIRGRAAKGGDHSTAGAVDARRFGPDLGRMLAFCIAGHHAGLANGTDLEVRLSGRDSLPRYDAHASQIGPLPIPRALRQPRCSPYGGFTIAFLTRMLFSCLVDADFLETERFYAEAKREPIDRGGHADLTTLRDRLRAHMVQKRANGASALDALDALRNEVLDHAVAKAVSEKPGLFTLTVPTGGGKTLASLSFALEHAVGWNKRRVVYVIPFTSIIEQTADVFRDALGTSDDVLEHHASFDWEDGQRFSDDEEGRDARVKLRLAAENWDVPIVVTTAVQFFESLFAAKTSRCRKLHNLADAMIVLDEAQTLPLKMLRPCVAALDELARNYGASVVLCTATQPNLRKQDDFAAGLDIPANRELAPDPAELYARLKRVTLHPLPQPVEAAEIAARFADAPQMLCIVNSRARARALFDAIAHMPGAVHLTTLMCPLHRRIVLGDLRDRLARGEPVRLAATSLIEAGVDISFPELWREEAGLDSVAQAAGRCNREGGPELGRVVVFKFADGKPPKSLVENVQAGGAILKRYGDASLGLEAVSAYFRELYWQKGDARAQDAAKVGGLVGILPAIAERERDRWFPFTDIAAAFRMIEDTMVPVVVPWRANPSDRDAEDLLRRIAACERPRGSDLRRLQLYAVPIPRKNRDEWLARGALKPVHVVLGDALLRFDDLAHYREPTGVDIADSMERDPASNLIE